MKEYERYKRYRVAGQGVNENGRGCRFDAPNGTVYECHEHQTYSENRRAVIAQYLGKEPNRKTYTDTDLLTWIANNHVIEGLVGDEHDIYEYACIVATERGLDIGEMKPEDQKLCEVEGLRRMITYAINRLG